jgi:hypothetical protein
MVADANLIAMFTQRYGAFIDPLPEEDSLARFATWVPPQSRLGNQYNFPLQGSLEHGQTADVSGNVFNYNVDVPMTLVNAQLDGFDWGMTARIPYSDMLRARNGVNQNGGGGAGSYFAPLDMKVKGLMRSSTLYRELWLAYGPGTGSTIASDIGQLATSGFTVSGGPNWNSATTVVKLKTASWIPGMWNLMKNAKLEVLNAAGTALVGSAGQFIQISGVPSATLTNVAINSATTTITAAIAAQQRLLPFGWYQKCCIGLEGILNNTGTLFGIDAAQYNFWRALQYGSVGKLSRTIILGVCSQLFPNGLDQGATLFVSSAQFADLAEETMVLGSGATQNAATTYGSGETTKRIGTNKIVYVAPTGEVTVQLYKFMKQGEAFLFGNGLVKRGGASDVTFKGDGNQYFLSEISGASGYEIRCISNQAVFIETPYQCCIFTGITSTFDVGGIVT